MPAVTCRGRMHARCSWFTWLASCPVSAIVECRIEVDVYADRTVVRVEGRLGGAQVPDLLQVCTGISRHLLNIDLTDLLNADLAGVEALRQLRREGATLAGLSEYLRLKLDSAV